MTNPALTPTAAAEYCGCSVRHFEKWIAPFLPVTDLGSPGSRKSMPRYREADLDAWLDARAQQPMPPRSRITAA